jgi:hypothetical protein
MNVTHMTQSEFAFTVCALLGALILIAAIWLWTARAFRRFGSKLDCCDPDNFEAKPAARGEPASLTSQKKLSSDGNNENPPALPGLGRFDALGAKIDALTARIEALTTFIEGEPTKPASAHPKRRATLKLVRGGKHST